VLHTPSERASDTRALQCYSRTLLTPCCVLDLPANSACPAVLRRSHNLSAASRAWCAHDTTTTAGAGSCCRVSARHESSFWHDRCAPQPIAPRAIRL